MTVDFATADGSATTAGADYAATSGVVTFNTGESAKTITVPVTAMPRRRTTRRSS